MKINSTKSHVPHIVAVFAMATSMLVSSQIVSAATDTEPKANAQIQNDAVVTASKAVDDQGKALTELSQEGFDAMRALHASRLAIFNGDAVLAKKMLHDAETLLMQAKADAANIAAKTKLSVGDSDVWLPIDGQIGLAETFVPTAEKEAAINKANDHISKNEKKAAIDTLKLAAIDVRYKRLLMPLKKTETQVSQAKKLIDAGKFYEANLAMKLAEEGMISDTIELVETATN